MNLFRTTRKLTRKIGIDRITSCYLNLIKANGHIEIIDTKSRQMIMVLPWDNEDEGEEHQDFDVAPELGVVRDLPAVDHDDHEE